MPDIARPRPPLWIVLLLAAGLACTAWLSHAAAVGDGQARLQVDEPRAFGQRVGDVVQRRVLLHLPAGRQLDQASLPQAGKRGRSIELRSVRLHAPAWWQLGEPPHELLLDYQLFVSPLEPRTLELPAFKLRLTGGARPEELRVEAWPVTLSPLVPREVSPRHGLGDLRPEARAPLIDTAPAETRLLGLAALAALALAYLAQVYLLAPWWAARRRPFARAHHAIRALGHLPSPARRQEALRLLHGALNQTAAEVLFAQGLDPFLARHPRYAPLRPELLAFFAQSRREFFADGNVGADPAVDLLRLARRCADLERGAA